MFGLFKKKQKDISEPVISFVENFKKCNFKHIYTNIDVSKFFDIGNRIGYIVSFEKEFEVFGMYGYTGISHIDMMVEGSANRLSWLTQDELDYIFKEIFACREATIERLARIKSKYWLHDRQAFKKIYCK